MTKNLNKIKNKIIIIYSDLSILLIKNNYKDIINNILEIIEILIRNKNTIILPTFNFNFAKNKKTSFKEEFITTGYLNKLLLKKYSFKRTKKPIYNFAAYGPKSLEILNLKQTTAFGEDSVIGYLSLTNAESIGIGIDPNNFNWVTIHVCEEIAKVPYRFYKKFKGLNLDTKKQISEVIFVRKKKYKVENTGVKIYKNLKKRKKIVKFKFKNLDVINLRLNDYFKTGMKLLKKNKFALVR